MSTSPTPDPALTSTIADRAARVRDRIAEAAHRGGRDPGAVTLVAVTKTRPLETVRAAVAAGLRDLGENRVQELVEKSDAMPGESAGGAVRWHLIGSLQRNKARDAAARADLFHALDSLRLANALDKWAAEAGRVLPVLVQVNISDEDAKHGLFTKHLLEALKGTADSKRYGNNDGKITVAEIKNYLDREMTYQARRRYNRDQVASIHGDRNTVLATYK